jgi:peptide deformylase
MAIRNILVDDNPRLRKKSKPVDKISPRTLEILDDMAETMYASKGLGLAAPQVGVLRRMMVVDVGDGLIELINPEIVKEDGQQREEEGCLSLPEQQGFVLRPAKIVVHALDRDGNDIRLTGDGVLARAFSHEIDHLDGILFIDKMIERTEHTDEKI